jgi:phage tail-like protein
MLAETEGNRFTVNIEGLGQVECREASGFEFSIGVILNDHAFGESAVRSSRGGLIPGRFRLGITDARSVTKLYNWFKEVTDFSKNLTKRKIVVNLKDRKERKVGTIVLKQCWPCHIHGPNLSKEFSQPLLQHFEFVYEGFALEGIEYECLS